MRALRGAKKGDDTARTTQAEKGQASTEGMNEDESGTEQRGRASVIHLAAPTARKGSVKGM